jgi:hypothetical protein
MNTRERLKKEEFLLGQGAIEMNSLWHRNFNIKDGETSLFNGNTTRYISEGTRPRNWNFLQKNSF